LSLLAQPLCFLRKAFLKGSRLCETAMLWHTLLHPFEDCGSATGVLITDNCHDTVRRWEQCAPGTSAAPEQKVRQNKKLTGRLAAGDGPRRTLLL
jgi:hypothetical protein